MSHCHDEGVILMSLAGLAVTVTAAWLTLHMTGTGARVGLLAGAAAGAGVAWFPHEAWTLFSPYGVAIAAFPQQAWAALVP